MCLCLKGEPSLEIHKYKCHHKYKLYWKPWNWCDHLGVNTGSVEKEKLVFLYPPKICYWALETKLKKD